MNKLRFIFVFFLFLVLPITVFATEAKIIVVGTGEVGDCVLIESKGEYLLVDTCNGGDTGFGVLEFLSKYLKNKEIKSLDILISHYHPDHINALYRNTGIFYNGEWNTNAKSGGKYYFFTSKIKKIYLPNPSYLGTYYDTSVGNEYLEKYYNYIKPTAQNLGIQVLDAWSDTSNGNINHFTFGDVVVDIIGPVGITCTSGCGREYDDANGFHGYAKGHYLNDHSLVTRFTIGNVKYLSAGDIESSVEVKEKVSSNNLGNYQEEKLVSSKCSELKADILKLNHHGLETSNGNAFLYCVNPKFAFYSKDNEVYANAVKPQIDQILYSWLHHINMFTTIDESNGGNGSFAFHIKDNHIEIEKINFAESNYTIFNSTKFTDITLNFLDENNTAIGSSTASFSNKEGAYYYLMEYVPIYINYMNGSYLFDFQKNSDISTGGTSLPSSVNIYYKKLNYTIDQEQKIIKGIDFHQKGTTLYSNFGFETGNDAVYYRNGLIDSRSDILRTGDEIRFKMNNRENVYKIAVRGDIEGKGYLTNDGIMKTTVHIIDRNVLTDASQEAAADYDNNGLIKMNDVMRMLADIDSQKISGFVTEENNKYYFDSDTGEMHIGWLTNDGNQYYFDKDGKMLVSWNVINGYLYYFDQNGILKHNLDAYSFSDEHYLLTNGGWLEFDNKKYYSTGNNTFITGWNQLDDNWYYFDATGKMLTGRQSIANSPRTNQY